MNVGDTVRITNVLPTTRDADRINGREGIVVENLGRVPAQARMMAVLMGGEDIPEDAEGLYVEIDGLEPTPVELPANASLEMHAELERTNGWFAVLDTEVEKIEVPTAA